MTGTGPIRLTIILGPASGVDQQRDAIFVLYNAYTSSGDAEKSACDMRGFIGQSLFPVDARFQIIPASEFSDQGSDADLSCEPFLRCGREPASIY